MVNLLIYSWALECKKNNNISPVSCRFLNPLSVTIPVLRTRTLLYPRLEKPPSFYCARLSPPLDHTLTDRDVCWDIRKLNLNLKDVWWFCSPLVKHRDRFLGAEILRLKKSGALNDYAQWWFYLQHSFFISYIKKCRLCVNLHSWSDQSLLFPCSFYF